MLIRDALEQHPHAEDFLRATVHLSANRTLYIEYNKPLAEYDLWNIPGHVDADQAGDRNEGERFLGCVYSEFEAQLMLDHYLAGVTDADT